MINFSVIIPNYNHAAFLEERINSVIGQILRPYEIILLDDASTDNSREIIEKFRSHPLVTHIVYNETNSGSPFIQWAHGIRMASSGWVWIAESDDIADPNFLKAAQDAISADPGTGIFYSDSALINTTSQHLPYKFFAEAKNRFFNSAKWSSPYCIDGKTDINDSMKWICTVNNSSAAVFRKDLLEEILDKLETFMYHGDWYCELAVAARSRVSYNPAALNQFRFHKESFLGRTNKMQSKLECFRILEFLQEHEFITGKEKLIEFFTVQYLNFGLLTDGISFGKKLFKAYSSINKPLSRKVLSALLKQKITGKRKRVIF